jgi:AcrR family transcriptional regulator
MPKRNRRRTDGERTHASILESATRIASIEGLHGLTLGRLADEIGVSKSGLYAHFGSKQRLQLEVIEAAGSVFAREVIEPALGEREGLRQLEALCEAYFSYVERWVFPGGCFFAALLAEADARSGPIHDAAVALQQRFLDLLHRMVRQAQRAGQLPRGVDAEQLAFEVYACMELANYLFVLFRDGRALARGRSGVRRILAGGRPTARRSRARRARADS